MDIKLKAKWVNALRSGKFKQANGKLMKQNGEASFCCLGVLCVLRRVPRAKLKDRTSLGWNYLHGLLPMAKARDLASMNDRGESFHAIADHIERYL